ncbi:MAG: hypothetical protein ACI9XC_001007 [Gammaproteobacteria bacterium]|jgi:hypothetical protein
MNVDQLTELFKWMAIINIGLLLLSTVLIMLLKNYICKIHAKLFGIDEDKIPIVVYGYLGIYKIMIIVLNIVPYIALLLIL